ncbi:hypothetical protein Bpfe_002674 [Biomphalaria pfeifferi]|uniref:Uncharacterized protein n=1 Tax=Biomphalaria pfeifferi TaxID=112525 RepID=A0AAD8FL10_BIOPF|nr:hypothetical protein Bpfe_002674 [Biomphalaria pfeifferi]
MPSLPLNKSGHTKSTSFQGWTYQVYLFPRLDMLSLPLSKSTSFKGWTYQFYLFPSLDMPSLPLSKAGHA